MNHIKHFLILCALVLLASCSKDDYTNTIPQDATFVASANIANMADESEFAKSQAVQTAHRYIGLLLSGKSKTTIESYLDDPRLFGIDFTKSAYIFKAGENIGMTMKIADDDGVEEFFNTLSEQGLCSKPKTNKGLTTAVVLGEVAVTFNKNTLLFVANIGNAGIDKAKAVAKQLMSQDRELSFTETEAFQRMNRNNKSDIVIFSNVAALPETVLSNVKGLIPSGIRPADVELIADVEFDRGIATISANVTGKTEKAQQMLDEGNANFHKIEGNYIDSPVDGFALFATMGVKGEWLLDQLKQEPNAKQILLGLERGIDIEQMLRSIDGDMAITVPSSVTLSTDITSADFMFLADLKKKDFLSDVSYWQSTMKDYGMTMRKTSGNDYVLQAQDYKLHWGVDDNTLYFASDRMFGINATSKRSTLLSSLDKQIRDSQFFLYLNLQQTLSAHRFGYAFLNNLAGRFQSLIVRSASSSNIEVTIRLKEDDENFLKTLLN